MQTTINGHKLVFDDFGDGQAVVLIHGFPLTRRMWAPQVEPLVDAGYRVIIPDLRGFGESEGGGSTVQMNDYADDIVALLDFLGIDRAVIGGMSMGGYVLMNLFDRYPQRVSAAMFLLTRAAADDQAGRDKRDGLIETIRSGKKDVIPDIFTALLFADSTREENPELLAEVRQLMDEVRPQGLVGGLTAMREREDYVDRLDMFRVPALVVGADRDRAVPIEHYEVLMEGLPDAEGVVIFGPVTWRTWKSRLLSTGRFYGSWRRYKGDVSHR